MFKPGSLQLAPPPHLPLLLHDDAVHELLDELGRRQRRAAVTPATQSGRHEGVVAHGLHCCQELLRHALQFILQ